MVKVSAFAGSLPGEQENEIMTINRNNRRMRDDVWSPAVQWSCGRIVIQLTSFNSSNNIHRFRLHRFETEINVIHKIGNLVFLVRLFFIIHRASSSIAATSDWPRFVLFPRAGTAYGNVKGYMRLDRIATSNSSNFCLSNFYFLMGGWSERLQLIVVSSFHEGIGTVVMDGLKVFRLYSKPRNVFVSF